MLLKEIMTPNVESISQDSTIREAARKMADLDIGFLAVIDEQGPVGVITDRDICCRVVAEGHDPSEMTVQEAMTPSVQIVEENQDVERAARLMREKQIRRLLVRGEHDRIVGVISLGDLAVDTGDDQLAGKTLHQISEPSRPSR